MKTHNLETIKNTLETLVVYAKPCPIHKKGTSVCRIVAQNQL